MDEVSVAGAEAVAVYFLQLYPYVYATNDLTEWRALSHPECVFCASVIQDVEEQAALGHYSEGGELVVQSIETIEVSSDFYSVIATVQQQAAIEYDAEGNAVDQSPAQPGQLSIAATTDGSTWLIRGIQVDEVPES